MGRYLRFCLELTAGSPARSRENTWKRGLCGGVCGTVAIKWSNVGNCGVKWRTTERPGLRVVGGGGDVSRHLHAEARRQGAAHAARQIPRRAGRRVDGHQEP